jgi:hypothetical protein
MQFYWSMFAENCSYSLIHTETCSGWVFLEIWLICYKLTAVSRSELNASLLPSRHESWTVDIAGLFRRSMFRNTSQKVNTYKIANDCFWDSGISKSSWASLSLHTREATVCWTSEEKQGGSSVEVEARCYKPEGHGFKTRWGDWIFSIYLILPAALEAKKIWGVESCRCVRLSLLPSVSRLSKQCGILNFSQRGQLYF